MILSSELSYVSDEIYSFPAFKSLIVTDEVVITALSPATRLSIFFESSVSALIGVLPEPPLNMRFAGRISPLSFATHTTIYSSALGASHSNGPSELNGTAPLDAFSP